MPITLVPHSLPVRAGRLKISDGKIGRQKALRGLQTARTCGGAAAKHIGGLRGCAGAALCLGAS